MPRLDYIPLAFQRTAAHHKGWAMVGGMDADLRLSKSLSLFADFDLWLLPYADARYAVEHSAMIAWHSHGRLQVMGGYKFVYARYPFGGEWNLGNAPWPFPIFDLVWNF